MNEKARLSRDEVMRLWRSACEEADLAAVGGGQAVAVRFARALGYEVVDEPAEPELPEGVTVERVGPMDDPPETWKSLVMVPWPGDGLDKVRLWSAAKPEWVRTALSALRREEGGGLAPPVKADLAQGDELWMRVRFSGPNTETRYGFPIEFLLGGMVQRMIADEKDIRALREPEGEEGGEDVVAMIDAHSAASRIVTDNEEFRALSKAFGGACFRARGVRP